MNSQQTEQPGSMSGSSSVLNDRRIRKRKQQIEKQRVMLQRIEEQFESAQSESETESQVIEGVIEDTCRNSVKVLDKISRAIYQMSLRVKQLSSRSQNKGRFVAKKRKRALESGMSLKEGVEPNSKRLSQEGTELKQVTGLRNRTEKNIAAFLQHQKLIENIGSKSISEILQQAKLNYQRTAVPWPKAQFMSNINQIANNNSKTSNDDDVRLSFTITEDGRSDYQRSMINNSSFRSAGLDIREPTVKDTLKMKMNQKATQCGSPMPRLSGQPPSSDKKDRFRFSMKQNNSQLSEKTGHKQTPYYHTSARLLDMEKNGIAIAFGWEEEVRIIHYANIVGVSETKQMKIAKIELNNGLFTRLKFNDKKDKQKFCKAIIDYHNKR